MESAIEALDITAVFFGGMTILNMKKAAEKFMESDPIKKTSPRGFRKGSETWKLWKNTKGKE